MTKKRFTDALFSLIPSLFWLLPLLLCEPFSVSLSLLSATLLHESGHVFAFFLTSSGAPRLEGRAFGLLLMPSRPLSYKKELVISLFGPLFNLLFAAFLFILSRPFFKEGELLFIFINLCVGASNLLPVSFFDGGRILFSSLALLFPLPVCEKISAFISFFTLFFLLFFSLWLMLLHDAGYKIFISVFLMLAFLAKKQR